MIFPEDSEIQDLVFGCVMNCWVQIYGYSEVHVYYDHDKKEFNSCFYPPTNPSHKTVFIYTPIGGFRSWDQIVVEIKSEISKAISDFVLQERDNKISSILKT